MLSGGLRGAGRGAGLGAKVGGGIAGGAVGAVGGTISGYKKEGVGGALKGAAMGTVEGGASGVKVGAGAAGLAEGLGKMGAGAVVGAGRAVAQTRAGKAIGGAAAAAGGAALRYAKDVGGGVLDTARGVGGGAVQAGKTFAESVLGPGAVTSAVEGVKYIGRTVRAVPGALGTAGGQMLSEADRLTGGYAKAAGGVALQYATDVGGGVLDTARGVGKVAGGAAQIVGAAAVGGAKGSGGIKGIGRRVVGGTEGTTENYNWWANMYDKSLEGLGIASEGSAEGARKERAKKLLEPRLKTFQNLDGTDLAQKAENEKLDEKDRVAAAETLRQRGDLTLIEEGKRKKVAKLAKNQGFSMRDYIIASPELAEDEEINKSGLDELQRRGVSDRAKAKEIARSSAHTQSKVEGLDNMGDQVIIDELIEANAKVKSGGRLTSREAKLLEKAVKENIDGMIGSFGDIEDLLIKARTDWGSNAIREKSKSTPQLLKHNKPMIEKEAKRMATEAGETYDPNKHDSLAEEKIVNEGYERTPNTRDLSTDALSDIAFAKSIASATNPKKTLERLEKTIKNGRLPERKIKAIKKLVEGEKERTALAKELRRLRGLGRSVDAKKLRDVVQEIEALPM